MKSATNLFLSYIVEPCRQYNLSREKKLCYKFYYNGICFYFFASFVISKISILSLYLSVKTKNFLPKFYLPFPPSKKKSGWLRACSAFHLSALEATYIKTLKPILCRQKEFVYFLQISH